MAFAGLLGSVLLYNQNQLLEKQNDKIDVQIQLEESSRRGNLIVMMSNIMDKVDEELTKREEKDSSRVLSNQLIGRIVALSYSFRPYRFWQDSTLIEKPLSPERGQLLIALVNSQLASNAYSEIFRRANFSKADLRGANLRNANLSYADLKGANLKKADLSKAILDQTRLNNADLERATLNEVQLSNTDFTGANLHATQFYDATILNMIIENANVEGIYLRSAKIHSTSFNNNLSNASFFKAHIEDSEFISCNLNNSDFRHTTFRDNNIIEMKFDNVKVIRKDWLSFFGENSTNSKGVKIDLTKMYYVDTTMLKDYVDSYYLIKAK